MKNIIAKTLIALTILAGVPTLGLANTTTTANEAGNIEWTAGGSYNSYRLPGFMQHTHRIYLERGYANIFVSGDGDTDLDLFIYDGYGNAVQRQNNYGDDEQAVFSISHGGYFTVVVKNLGKVYNDYTLLVRQ